MKAEGGLEELVDDYGRILLAILIVIIVIAVFLAYVASHPQMGVTLPPLFGGAGK